MGLTDVIREALAHLENVEEKRMFRGIAFMIDGKMCFTTGDHRLLCRVDPKLHDELLLTKKCTPMIMRGKENRGWLYVDEEDLKSEENFEFWINSVINFNKSL